MRHTWKIAVAAAVLAGCAGTAKADLTLSGQTGLFINPTAQIVQKGAPEIAGNYEHTSESDLYYKYTDLSINGAIQAADKLELNAGYTHQKSDYYTGNFWHVGAKYQLLSHQQKGFDLAVGADYGKFQYSDDTNENNYLAYVVATKAFHTSNKRAPIEGTLGLRWDRYTSDYAGNDSNTSVYAGVQIPLTRTGKLSLIGELGSKRYNDADSIYAIGVRYHPENSALSLGAGFGRPDGTPGATTIFAQVGYTFGK